ncbi:MAG TPA: hypothetical protein VF713_03115 [Thermoanaerobaculia bacterium]
MLFLFASLFFQLVPGTFASVAVDGRAAIASSELVANPIVLAFCRTLIRKAAVERYAEQGAFVVRTQGILYFVVWPPGAEKDMLRWYGRFPDGTIAIVHTHPPWIPQASNLDLNAARGAHIPVYVLTPFRISKTAGGPSEVVIEGDLIDPGV